MTAAEVLRKAAELADAGEYDGAIFEASAGVCSGYQDAVKYAAMVFTRDEYFSHDAGDARVIALLLAAEIAEEA